MKPRQPFGRCAVPSVMALLALSLLSLLTGCSWFSSAVGRQDVPGATTVSVFKVVPGQCFNPPAEKAELADLTAIPCGTPHTQESYASLVYKPLAGVDPSTYPGDAALASFANGSCAQAFNGYVGISYLDSSLYFTYLVPSARSWEQKEDRSVLCLVITTGRPLTSSVKGSKL